jgi:hypothetical protein
VKVEHSADLAKHVQELATRAEAHNLCMRRDSRRHQEQHERFMAYMTDDRTSAEERGRVMLALVGHAFIYLLFAATDAIWVVLMAVRVWRRREGGMTEATRTGVHKPTLAVLLTANLLYVILLKVARAKLHRQSSKYLAHPRGRA